MQLSILKIENYDKKPPETPPLPEFAEQKEEVSERDTETITDITDVERGESVLGSREQPDTDVSGASERVTTGVRGVPTSVSKPTPDTSGERGRPRREDESVDPTEGQDVQSRNEVEGRLVGDNITEMCLDSWEILSQELNQVQFPIQLKPNKNYETTLNENTIMSWLNEASPVTSER